MLSGFWFRKARHDSIFPLIPRKDTTGKRKKQNKKSLCHFQKNQEKNLNHRLCNTCKSCEEELKLCGSCRGRNKKQQHRWWWERPGMADCKKCQQETPSVNNAAMNIEHRGRQGEEEFGLEQATGRRFSWRRNCPVYLCAISRLCLCYQCGFISKYKYLSCTRRELFLREWCVIVDE